MDKLTAAKIQEWMEQLCSDPRGRSVGTDANRAASGLFIAEAQKCGAELDSQEFDCLDFDPGRVELRAGGNSFQAFASPYSLPCDACAELVEVSTVEQLMQTDARGKILLLHGQIASGQIMPKNFVFYNPEEHQHLVQHLESSGVAAVITASPIQPVLNAAVYPCPMFEDGDLDFASVFMSVEEGERLLPFAGSSIRLLSTAKRIPKKAIHAMASYGPRDGRVILISAHLDSKPGTPGASDNAGGTAVTLALLHLLKDYKGLYRVQIIPFNGEDYYAVPGEMIFLRDFEPAKLEICVNMDSVGVKDGRTGYCEFNLSDRQKEMFYGQFCDEKHFVPIEPWYQGDHAIFAMQGLPAIALSTENLQAFFTEYAHTPKDGLELMDSSVLLHVAERLADMVKGWRQG